MTHRGSVPIQGQLAQRLRARPRVAHPGAAPGLIYLHFAREYPEHVALAEASHEGGAGGGDAQRAGRKA